MREARALEVERAAAAPGSAAWEAAYLRFETSEEEIRKFTARLEALGQASWPRSAELVELFCGRGGGLVALERLGFTELEGVDLSPTLLARYSGPARCHLADCRALPFADASKDVLLAQGGLHHLALLPDDLELTLAEASRVLRPGGRFVAVEPWRTPFLALVHAASRVPFARALSSKLDAFAVMVEHERETYERWLAAPGEILARLERHFAPERRATRWGKLAFVGRKR